MHCMLPTLDILEPRLLMSLQPFPADAAAAFNLADDQTVIGGDLNAQASSFLPAFSLPADVSSAFGFPVKAEVVYFVNASGIAGNYLMALDAPPADDYGNDSASARSMRLKSSTTARLSGKINYAGDSDWRMAVAPADGLIRIVPSAMSAGLTCVLRAYDAEGNLLAEGDAAGISFQATKGQTFYLSVWAADSIGKYSFSILPTLPTRFINVEEAQVLPCGLTQLEGTIQAPGDVVIRRFQVVGKGRFRLDLTAADGSNLDGRLEVFDSNGRRLALNDNVGASRNSSINIRVSQGQVLYVAASGTGETTGDFTLSLTSLPIDDVPDGLDNATTLKLTRGGYVRAVRRINYPQDVDATSFVAATTGTMNIAMLRGKAQHGIVEVFDSNHQPVAVREYSSGPLEGSLSIHVEQGQRYYVTSTFAAGIQNNLDVMAAQADSSTGRYTLVVKTVPDTAGPVMAPIADQAGAEGMLLSFTVETHPANGEVLTMWADDLPDGADFDSQTGDFKWTPDADQAGDYSITFTVSDGLASSSQTIAISVANVNGVPVMDPVGNKTIEENQFLQFAVSATDPEGDPLTYAVNGLPSGAIFNSDTRTFSWTPNYIQAGTYHVTFTASDGLLTGNCAIDIVVSNVNRSPVMSPVGNKTTNENQALQFAVTANDADGDSLVYSASGLPAGATFNPATRTFSWTPGFSQAGTYHVTFSASDGSLVGSSTIDILVFNVNRPPVLDAIGNKAGNENQLLQFVVNATDPDGGSLTYSASGLPAGATFNPQTRTFSWTPSYSQAGSYSVTFNVSDGTLTDSSTVSIAVANTDRAPVMGAIGSKTTNENQALQFVVSASDADGDSITYSASNLPAGATFNAATRTFSWTPSYSQAGSYNVTFSASDGSLTGSSTISITVADVNRAPTLSSIGTLTGAYADESFTITYAALAAAANEADADGQTISFLIDSLISGTLTKNGQAVVPGETMLSPGESIIWQADEGVVGVQDAFSVRAWDGQAASASAVPVRVEVIAGAPVLDAIGHKVVLPGATVQFTIHATDPNGDPIIYSAANLPAGATFDPATATFTWTPAADQTGPFPGIRFIVSDGQSSRYEDITITANTVNLGKGATNAYYIDNDADGYGTASPLGPDADDNDPTVNTPQTMLDKYGTLQNFLSTVKGYGTQRIFYIASDGNNGTAAVNDISHPYATWAAVKPLLQPGDTVLYREGTYRTTISMDWPPVQGAEGNRISIMTYPGEEAIINAYGGIYLGYSGNIGGPGCSHIAIDGLILEASTIGQGYGIEGHYLTDAIIRNIEVRNFHTGIDFNAHNAVIENSVIHDSRAEHAIYLGSNGNSTPNENIAIRGNILYHNGRHGFQHNGPVTNLLIEGNIIHSNLMGGISLIMGTSYSTVRNNLIFNNNKQGIILYNYDDPNPSILPHDQVHNVIENNTIWVGQYSWDGGGTGPSEHGAIVFNNAGNPAEGITTLDNNTIRNNILVTYNGPALWFYQQDYADTTVVENNLFYRVRGDSRVMTYGATDYSMAGFNAFSPLFRNNLFADPLFQDVSLNYNLTPEKFIFDLLANSPAINFGSSAGAPSTDLRGQERTEPDAGGYED